MKLDRIEENIRENIDVKKKLMADPELVTQVRDTVIRCVKALRAGGKILFCGNGGSAADAQHLAAELSGRYLIDRPPINAEALHVNTSYLTAVANDYSFDQVYARRVEAIGNKADVLIALSTSGASENIIQAMMQAKGQGLVVVGLTGARPGRMLDVADILIHVPSRSTPRIQEAHILIGHIICELIENAIFGDNA